MPCKTNDLRHELQHTLIMPFDIYILSFKDILDILLVAFLLYKSYKLMKSSGSINIFIGILVFIIIG